MKRLFLCVTTALLSVYMLSSCSKESSAGPQGPPGTANVIYSDWMDVAFDEIAPDTLYQAEISAPKMVDSIINKGEIKVYVNIGTTAEPLVMPLPILENFLLGVIINCYFEPGTIHLLASGDVSTFTSSGQKSFQYRYVLIPGGTTANSSINWNNYEEVKKSLELKD